MCGRKPTQKPPHLNKLAKINIVLRNRKKKRTWERKNVHTQKLIKYSIHTHCSKRVWGVVPVVMFYHLFCAGGTCVSYYSLKQDCELRGCNLRLNKQSSKLPLKVL